MPNKTFRNAFDDQQREDAATRTQFGSSLKFMQKNILNKTQIEYTLSLWGKGLINYIAFDLRFYANWKTFDYHRKRGDRVTRSAPEC